MNKVTRILLAVGLILAVATPALAEFKFNGYYRLIGYTEEKKASGNIADDKGDSQQFIDQRFRAKLTYSLNDNVALVYFAEVDTTWGENNKAGINQGGMSNSFGGGADGVNVETKQVYLDLKYGDTAVQMGIIGVADAFESIVANDDMAGVQATHKMGNTSFKLVYSKWDEDDFNDTTPSTGATDSNVRGDWDDFDFYAAEVNQKFSDNFKAGLGVYYMDNNSATASGTLADSNISTVPNSNNNTSQNTADGDAEIWFYGVNGDARFGNFAVNGFFVYQDGEGKYAAGDVDFKAMAASVKANYKLSNGDVGLRVIYFSEDDDAKDNGRWQGFKGQYSFVKENQMQFLTDPYVMNDGKERYAEVDAVQAGYGLLAFVLSGNHKLPQDMYLNWGAGYYMAMDEERDDQGFDSRKGDTLGYEVCVRFGKKFFEKVDVSLNASYAGYGDFYDNTVSDASDNGIADGTRDPDDTYKAYVMVNVPF